MSLCKWTTCSPGYTVGVCLCGIVYVMLSGVVCLAMANTIDASSQEVQLHASIASDANAVYNGVPVKLQCEVTMASIPNNDVSKLCMMYWTFNPRDQSPLVQLPVFSNTNQQVDTVLSKTGAAQMTYLQIVEMRTDLEGVYSCHLYCRSAYIDIQKTKTVPLFISKEGEETTMRGNQEHTISSTATMPHGGTTTIKSLRTTAHQKSVTATSGIKRKTITNQDSNHLSTTTKSDSSQPTTMAKLDSTRRASTTYRLSDDDDEEQQLVLYAGSVSLMAVVVILFCLATCYILAGRKWCCCPKEETPDEEDQDDTSDISHSSILDDYLDAPPSYEEIIGHDNYAFIGSRLMFTIPEEAELQQVCERERTQLYPLHHVGMDNTDTLHHVGMDNTSHLHHVGIDHTDTVGMGNTDNTVRSVSAVTSVSEGVLQSGLPETEGLDTGLPSYFQVLKNWASRGIVVNALRLSLAPPAYSDVEKQIEDEKHAGSYA